MQSFGRGFAFDGDSGCTGRGCVLPGTGADDGRRLRRPLSVRPEVLQWKESAGRFGIE